VWDSGIMHVLFTKVERTPENLRIFVGPLVLLRWMPLLVSAVHTKPCEESLTLAVSTSDLLFTLPAIQPGFATVTPWK
jgi:hypothetical protein